MNSEGCSTTGPDEVNGGGYETRDFSDAAPLGNGAASFAVASDGMSGHQGDDGTSGIVEASAERTPAPVRTSYPEHMPLSALGRNASMEVDPAEVEKYRLEHYTSAARRSVEGPTPHKRQPADTERRWLAGVDLHRPADADKRQPAGMEEGEGNGLPKNIVIPIAALVALALIVGIIFFATSNKGSDTGGSTQGQSVAASQAAGGSGAAASAGGAQSGSAPTATNKTYEVGEGALLKYIDSSKTAHRFDEEPFEVTVEVALVQGGSVTADTVASAYGFEETGNSYLALAENYRDDLIHDCVSYAEGATSFDSSLAQIADSDSYKKLLEELVNFATNGVTGKTVASEVSRLVVDESSLVAN